MVRRWLPEAEYRYINSSEFLRSPEWREVRLDAIGLNAGRCESCGRLFGPGLSALNVDHIRPRATHPHLALDKRNLQCLCAICNAMKGNLISDHRSPYHPYRITWWRRLHRWWRS